MAKHSKKMKLLINTPSLKILGGVANHYIGLRAFWTQNVKYNIVGRRGEKSGSGKYWLPWDIFKFMFRLLHSVRMSYFLTHHLEIMHLNVISFF